MSQGQDLNSLDRFRKHPGRLVLEEHGHCEIPAGCGGVVLRWRNPHVCRPVLLYLYTPIRAAIWLDGVEPYSARVDLAPGNHSVAVAVEKVDLRAGLLMFAAIPNPDHQQTPPAADVEPPFKVLSADDGTWKFSLTPPPENWNTLEFDDRDWPALTRRPTPQLDWNQHGAWPLNTCTQQGAVCLGLPEGGGKGSPRWWQRLLGLRESSNEPLTGSIWIRKVFQVETAAPPP